MSSGDGPIQQKRLALVRNELRHIGVGKNDPKKLFDALATTIHDVLTQPPHEARHVSTGVLLLSEPIGAYQLDKHSHLKTSSDLSEGVMWHLADGVYSFLTRDPTGSGLLMLESPLTDELALFALRDDALFVETGVHPDDEVKKELLIVRRQPESPVFVTVLARERIVTISKERVYASKDYQYALMGGLHRHIKPFPWSSVDEQTIRSVLRVAVHMLSPARIGATLVVLTRSDADAFEALVSNRQIEISAGVRPHDFNVTKRSHQRPLIHLIAQMDGATIISHRGQVLLVGAFIKQLDEHDVGEQGAGWGTRHRSALAVSKLLNGVVIVVSQDGPVSLFHRGISISAG